MDTCTSLHEHQRVYTVRYLRQYWQCLECRATVSCLSMVMWKHGP